MKFKNLILIAMTFIIISLISSMAFAVTTSDLDFNNVAIGSTSSAAVTITNDELVSFNITDITYTDLTNSGVNIASTNLVNPAVFPLTLTPGQTISITVDFGALSSLAELGDFNGQLTVHTNTTTVDANTHAKMVSEDFDFAITGMTYNPSPVYDGVATSFDLSTSIIGSLPSSVINHCIMNTVHVDFGDSNISIEDFTSPNLFVYNTYTSANTFDINASLVFPDYCIDINTANNELILPLTVLPTPTYDLVMPNTFTFDMYRGTTDSLSGDEVSNGNVDIDVTNTISGLTGLTSNVNPSTIIGFAPSTTQNVDVSVTVPSTGVSPLTQINGTLDATFNTISGLDTEQSDIIVNVLNYQPDADITTTVAIEGNSFSSTITTSDADTMDTATCTVTGGSAMSWLTAAGCSSLSGTAPAASSPTPYTVIMDVTDGYETVQVTRTITVMPDLPYISSSDVTFSGDRDNTYTEQITITNTGVQNLNNIVIDLQSISSSLNANLGTYATSLVVGDSMTVPLTLTIPDNQDSGIEDVGNIYVTADGNSGLTTSDNSDVFIDADSMLNIENVDIEVDGENDQHDSHVNVGDDFEIYQGDDFTIQVNLENTYSSSQDVDINNVYYELEADDNDFNIDFTSDEVSRIEASEDDEIELSFEIDTDNLNDGDTTTVTIRAYGEDDDNNFDHYDEFTFDLEYTKEDDKITITNWNLNPTVVSCDDSSFTLSVEVTNEGYDEQDDVFVRLESDFTSFWLNTNSAEIDNFDEDDDNTFTFTIPISNGLTQGIHTINAYAYYGYSEHLGDYETIWIDVQGPNCYVSTTGGNTGSNTESNTGTNSSSNTGTNTGSSTEENVLAPSTGGSLVNVGPMIEGWITDTSSRFRLSDGVKIILWSLLGLIVLAAIALGIVALVRRRRN